MTFAALFVSEKRDRFPIRDKSNFLVYHVFRGGSATLNLPLGHAKIHLRFLCRGK